MSRLSAHSMTAPALTVVFPLEGQPFVFSTAMNDGEAARLLAWLERPSGGRWRELFRTALRLARADESIEYVEEDRHLHWPAPGTPAHDRAIASLARHLEGLDDETLIIETVGNLAALAQVSDVDGARFLSLAEAILRGVLRRFAPDALEQAEQATAAAIARRVDEYRREQEAC